MGLGCIRWDLRERHQRKTAVAQLLEQAVQRRLVDDRAAEDGCAVVLVPERQSVEPTSPSGPEVSLDSDLVLHRSTVRSDLVSRPHIMW